MHEQATEAGLSQIALLDHILSSVSDGIHVIDMNGTVLIENEVSARMLGWCKDYVVGKLGHAAIHHHHADGSAFAGSVVAQQAEDFSTRHGQVQVIDGQPCAESFGETAQLDHFTPPTSSKFLMWPSA